MKGLDLLVIDKLLPKLLLISWFVFLYLDILFSEDMVRLTKQ